ncbi:hypothetical protein ARMSODRAFT_222782 [Armillaria solidipes]|uniref:Uncharacterized protein n=1 Tax=Armillaria solidipes TaxID=1076256 RepID=A0A2H3CAR2_9AGAR|nr:hypothetical protein ARMSODRAFT_222782 [Armillaria solidipes]
MSSQDVCCQHPHSVNLTRIRTVLDAEATSPRSTAFTFQMRRILVCISERELMSKGSSKERLCWFSWLDGKDSHASCQGAD